MHCLGPTAPGSVSLCRHREAVKAHPANPAERVRVAGGIVSRPCTHYYLRLAVKPFDELVRLGEVPRHLCPLMDGPLQESGQRP